MTMPRDQHLTEADLELLVSSERTSVPNRDAGSDDLVAIREHLGSCEQCRSQAQSFFNAQEMLRSLKRVDSQPKTSDCPPESVWAVVAAGQIDSTEAMRLLKHATDCDYCGPQLSLVTSILTDESDAGEQSALATLETSNSESRFQLANRLASSARFDEEIRLRRRRSFWPTRWVTVAALSACAALIATVIWFAVGISPEVRVDRLLASAYSEQRTMELRFPNAKYGPVRVQRGSSSQMNKPPALLEAEALIARKLAENGSAKWLQAKARAELLDGNYDGAISNLTTVLQRSTDSGSALDDLGAAYFQRGLTLDRPGDIAQAVELYGKALTKNPKDPIALFNRAIASEHIFLYRQAVEDWRNYLTIDPSGGWSEEAKQRLHKLTERLKAHEQSLLAPLLTPQELHAQDEHRADEFVDQRIEEYLRLSAHEWWPKYLASPPTRQYDANTILLHEALFKVARIAATNHGDVWLKELLNTKPSPPLRRASQFLASALTFSESGDFTAALASAHEAEIAFRQSDSEAGVLRAELEQVYALHLSQQGDRCLSKAAALLPVVEHRNFSWIREQLWIETAICSSITGRLDSARTFYQRALLEAQSHSYQPLFLRASLGLSDLDSLVGNRLSSWRRDSSGLALFYSTPIPKVRGYSLYTDLDTLADEGHQLFLEVSILRQAIDTLGDDPDLLQRAMLHSRLATTAAEANIFELAEREFQEAARLFALCPQSDSVRANLAETRIWIARVDVGRSDYKSAIRHLSEIQQETSNIKNAYTQIAFNETLGLALMRSGDMDAALKPLLSAVSTAEEWLATLPEQRDRIFWKLSAENAYRYLAECQWRSGSPEQSLETVARFRSAIKNGRARAVNFSAVREALPKMTAETVIAYLVLDDGMIEWMFDDRGIQTEFVPMSRPNIEQLVSQYLALCSNPESDPSLVRRDARQLYGLLLAPVASLLLPSRTLVIQPDPLLRNIPYLGLLDDDGKSDRQALSIVVSPGLEIPPLSDLHNHVQTSDQVLVVGAPAVGFSDDEYFRALPEARRESEAIAQEFPHGLLLLGSHANLGALRASLPTVTVFHFAGHAVAAQGHAGLLLAKGMSPNEPQLLSSDQIDSLRLTKMKLVVLSACTTKATDNDFVDADDIVLSLLRAGTHAVVASRWNVDTEATRTLMLYFYDSLLSGSSPADALRTATMKLRARPEYSHPYFWAAFQTYSS